MTGTGFAAPLATEHVLDIFDRVIADTVPSQADQLELCLLGRAGEYTRFAGERIHQPQDITETQFLVRAICEGRAYRTSTTILRGVRQAAADAVRAVCRPTQDGPRGAAALAVRPDRLVNEFDTEMWCEDTASFDTGRRSALAHAAMLAARRAGGHAAGMFARAAIQQIVATSTDIRRSIHATEASGSLTTTVEDGSSHWVDVGRSANRLDVSQATVDTIDQAIAGRGRISLAPGRYTVVLGPEAVGEILQFLPPFGFSASLAADGIGVCANRHGEPLASPLVTVADDAAANVGLPLPFDIEGTSKRRVVMLDHGTVGEPVSDVVTARALGTSSSTGHAHIAREQAPAPEAANIVMRPGASEEDALLQGIQRGVYIQRFWYTRLVDRGSSTITGVTRDASFLIEDGRLTKPLEGTRFTQSVFNFLATIDGVGRQLRSQPVMNVWNGATSAPAVRGHDFSLGTPTGDTWRGRQ